MSTNTTVNQEIDLSLLTKKIGSFIDALLAIIFNAIQYVKKNIILFGVLIIVGYCIGYYMDSKSNTYMHDVTVTPNFGSTDYLYDKVTLLNARLGQEDTIFLKSIGLNEYKKISFLEVAPVIDIYNFVNNNATSSANNAQNSQNFELVKLLAEDGDIKKVIKDELTSKNYGRHIIHIVTRGFISNKNTIDPILAYLNNSDFYGKYQKTYVDNLNIKINENKVVISQIDGLLNQFSATANSAKGDKLVYYNENSQIGDILSTKNNLSNENQYLKNQLVSLDKIIKETSRITNIKNTKGLGNKMRFVLPIFFLFVFLGFTFFMAFYKKQAAKLL
jgi:uncharacterized membrane protein